VVLALLLRLRHLYQNDVAHCKGLQTAFNALLGQCTGSQYNLALKCCLKELASGEVGRVTASLACLGQALTKGQVSGRREKMAKSLPELLHSFTVITVTFSPHSSKSMVEGMCDVLASLLSKFQAYPMSSGDMTCVLQTLLPIVQQLDQDVFLSVQQVLLAAIKYRPRLVSKSIAAFLQCTRPLLYSTLEGVHKQHTEGVCWDVELTEGLSRLYQQMGTQNNKKALGKHCTYLMVDYINATHKFTLTGSHKRVLLPGIYSLMTCCSEYEFKQVHCALDQAGKALFKTLHAEFCRTFKYSGKV